MGATDERDSPRVDRCTPEKYIKATAVAVPVARDRFLGDHASAT